MEGVSLMLRSEFVAQLDAVEAFMASPAYPEIQKALDSELDGLNISILSTAPTTTEAVAILNMCHGTRTSVLRQQTYFEGLRNALKTTIDQMDEDGTIVAETTNT